MQDPFPSLELLFSGLNGCTIAGPSVKSPKLPEVGLWLTRDRPRVRLPLPIWEVVGAKLRQDMHTKNPSSLCGDDADRSKSKNNYKNKLASR